jgi:hemolysin III
MREGVTLAGPQSSIEQTLDETLERAKPALRGWLHAGTFPVMVVAGLLLVVLSPTLQARFGAAVFTLTGMLLFGVSAAYHRGVWSPRVDATLRRLDHSNIFLLIAGTYTPFALLLLSASQAWLLLTIVWAGALAGVGFRTFWVGAPRWLYTPVYLALGWTAVFWIDDFARAGGAAVLTLIVVGGALYSCGGLVYALKRPNPSPRWFGFHEVFHSLTVAAFTVHYVALLLATYHVA